MPLQTIVIGNQANRVDIVNAAAGVSGQLGRWVLTNGFVAPVTATRGFDFEYNLQAQRAF